MRFTALFIISKQNDFCYQQILFFPEQWPGPSRVGTAHLEDQIEDENEKKIEENGSK